MPGSYGQLGGLWASVSMRSFILKGIRIDFLVCSGHSAYEFTASLLASHVLMLH